MWSAPHPQARKRPTTVTKPGHTWSFGLCLPTSVHMLLSFQRPPCLSGGDSSIRHALATICGSGRLSSLAHSRAFRKLPASFPSGPLGLAGVRWLRCGGDCTHLRARCVLGRHVPGFARDDGAQAPPFPNPLAGALAAPGGTSVTGTAGTDRSAGRPAVRRATPRGAGRSGACPAGARGQRARRTGDRAAPPRAARHRASPRPA